MFEASSPLQAGRIKVIACEAVIQDILPHLPPDADYHVLDLGLHLNPAELKRALQQVIDDSSHSVDTILLGYGLCSQAVVGLRANGCTLVVPKVDDCIALLLGSAEDYRAQFQAEPGTYYLTKGWIEAGDSPFDEYDDLVQRFGEQKAKWLMGKMLNHYTRLALIDTGQHELGQCRDYCRDAARRFGLRYEEIIGCSTLIRQMLHGPLDHNFVIARPGETISYLDFKSAGQN